MLQMIKDKHTLSWSLVGIDILFTPNGQHMLLVIASGVHKEPEIIYKVMGTLDYVEREKANILQGLETNDFEVYHND